MQGRYRLVSTLVYIWSTAAAERASSARTARARPQCLSPRANGTLMARKINNGSHGLREQAMETCPALPMMSPPGLRTC
jgi:hypothetical protein